VSDINSIHNTHYQLNGKGHLETPHVQCKADTDLSLLPKLKHEMAIWQNS